DEDFHVGEAAHDGLGQRSFKITTDRLGHRAIRIAGDDLDIPVIAGRHCKPLSTATRWPPLPVSLAARAGAVKLTATSIQRLICSRVFGLLPNCASRRKRPSGVFARLLP